MVKKHRGILLAVLLAICLPLGASAMAADLGGEPLAQAMADTAADRAGIRLIAVLDDGVAMQNVDGAMRREMLRWYLSALCVGEESRVAAIPFQQALNGHAPQWSPLTTAADQRAWMSTPINRIGDRDRAQINQGITDSLSLARQLLAEDAGEAGTLDMLLLSVNYWDELAPRMGDEDILTLADARFAVMTAKSDNMEAAEGEIGEMARVLLALQEDKPSQDEVLAFLSRAREAVEAYLPGIYTTQRVPFVQNAETGAWGVAIDLSNPTLRGVDLISDALPDAASNDPKITLSAPSEDGEPVSLADRGDVMSYQSKGDRILVHWDRQTMGTGVWQMDLGRLGAPEGFGAELVLYHAPVEMIVSEAPETLRRGEPLTLSARLRLDGSPVRPEDLPENAVAVASVNETALFPMTLTDDGEGWTVTIPPEAMRIGMGLEENAVRLHIDLAGSEEPLAEASVPFAVKNHAPTPIAGMGTEPIVWALGADMAKEEALHNAQRISFRAGDAAAAAQARSWTVGSLFFDEDSDTGDAIAFHRATVRKIDAAGNLLSTEEISAGQGSDGLIVFESLAREDARYEMDIVARDLAGAEASTTLHVQVEDRASDLAALWYEPSVHGVTAQPEGFSCAKTDQPVLAVTQGDAQTRFTAEETGHILAGAALRLDITGPEGETWTDWGTAMADASQKQFLLPVPPREGLYTYKLSLQSEQGYPLSWPDGAAVYVFSLRVDNAQPVLLADAWPAGQDAQGQAGPWMAVVETRPLLGFSLYKGPAVALRAEAFFADADQDALSYYIAPADATQKPLAIEVDGEAGVVHLRSAEGNQSMPAYAATALEGARTWTLTTAEARDFAVMLFASDAVEPILSASPGDVSHGVIHVEGKSTTRTLIRIALLALLVLALAIVALLLIRQARKPSFGSKDARALVIAVERDGVPRAPRQQSYTVPLRGYGKRDITLELLLHCLPLTGVRISPDRARKIVLRPAREGIALRDDTGTVRPEGTEKKGKWAILTRKGRIRVPGEGGALIIGMGGNEHGAD